MLRTFSMNCQENISLVENVTCGELLKVESDGELSTIFNVLALVLAVFGAIGNGLFLVSVWKEKRLRTISNYFIAHLCGVDLLNCLIIVPLLRAFTELPFTIKTCWYFNKFLPVLPVMSMYSQLLVAVNRYYLLTLPSPRYQHAFTLPKSVIGAAVGWGFHLLLTVVLVGIKSQPKHTETRVCDRFPGMLETMLITSARMYGFYILYFCTSLAFYIKLGRYVRCNTSTLTEAKRSDSQLSSTLLQISVVSFVSTLVSPLIVLMVVVFRTGLDPTVAMVFEELGLLCFGISYCVNPLFYGYKIKLFRETVWNIVRYHRHRTAPLQAPTYAFDV